MIALFEKILVNALFLFVCWFFGLTLAYLIDKLSLNHTFLMGLFGIGIIGYWRFMGHFKKEIKPLLITAIIGLLAVFVVAMVVLTLHYDTGLRTADNPLSLRKAYTYSKSISLNTLKFVFKNPFNLFNLQHITVLVTGLGMIMAYFQNHDTKPSTVRIEKPKAGKVYTSQRRSYFRKKMRR